MKNLADLTMPSEMGRKDDTSIAGLQMIEPKAAKPTQVAKKTPRPNYRLPTKDEQIRGWEKLVFEINLHRTVTGDMSKVEACLKRLDMFVDAHAKGEKGELSIEEIRKNVVQVFWENIVQTPMVGLAPINVPTQPAMTPPDEEPKRKKAAKKPEAKAPRAKAKAPRAKAKA